MIHPESKYIQIGYKFETATRERKPALAETIRRMIAAEAVEDRAQARYLIERGQKEARTYH